MKTFELLKNSIAHLFKCEAVAAIMILLSLFCIYFSQFAFSGMMNHLREQRLASSSYTSICITPTDAFDARNALDFFETCPLGEMRNAFVVDLDTTGNRPQMVGWKGTAFTRWEALEAGMEFFTDSQVESNERIAMMSVTSLGERPNERDVNGTVYSIIEHGSLSVSMLLRKFPSTFAYYIDEYGNNDELIVPYHTFFEQGFKPDAIVLDMKEALSGSDERVTSLVAEYFPNCGIHLVANSQQTKDRANDYAEMQSIFAGMSVLAALSIFTFFNGWIRQNARQYQIYILCGATRAKIFQLVLIEWGILTAMAGVCACAAMMLVTPLLSDIGFIISMKPIDYMEIIILGLILSFLSSLKTLFMVCANNYRQGVTL